MILIVLAECKRISERGTFESIKNNGRAALSHPTKR
jgi:hypothetical protein